MRTVNSGVPLASFMDAEQLQNFNERLNQWVSRQGLWFQIRHSVSLDGNPTGYGAHAARLFIRVLLLASILACLVLAYLVKRTEFASFREKIQNSLAEGLDASDAELKSVSRKSGQITLTQFLAVGGPDRFFSTLEIRNVRGRMNLIDGLVTNWNPGTVSIGKLDVTVNSSFEDEAAAKRFAQTLFHRSEKVKVDRIEVADATLRWGDSERNRGSIARSSLKMQRTAEGWQLRFKGGEFSQNWLHGLAIKELTVKCTPSGLVFEEAAFGLDEGSVSLKGVSIEGGMSPKVGGTLAIERLNLEHLLPEPLRPLAEGIVSGEFRVSGSTHPREGVEYDGLLKLGGGDFLLLRDRIPLLRALSVVDIFNAYRRLEFHEGSLQVNISKNGVAISDIAIKADDLMTVAGMVRARPPTFNEKQSIVEPGESSEFLPLFVPQNDRFTRPSPDKTPPPPARAQSATQAQKGEGRPNKVLERFTALQEQRIADEQISKELPKSYRYEGNLTVTLRRDVFDQSEELKKLFPANPETGRIPLEVPLSGHLFELTLPQAEYIYRHGKR